MLTYIITFITVLPIFFILHYNYMSSATKNSSSQYLAVHIPMNCQDDSDFISLLSEYRSKIRTVTGISILTFMIAVQLLLIPAISAYVTVFLSIIFLSIYLPMATYNRILYKYREKLLDLKADKGWKVTVSGKLYADLATSRMKNRRTPKEYLFFLPALLSLAIYLYYEKTFGMTTLLITNLFVHALTWGIFRVVKHMPAKMYSTDSQTNLLLNQGYRRNWSYAYLTLSFVQSIFMLALAAISFRFMNEPDYAMSGYFIGTIFFMSFFPIAIIFILYLQQRRKEQSLLNKQNTFIGEDEDCYYEPHGFWGLLYNNPYSNAVTVPKPFGIGQTTNIATKKGYLYFQFGKWVTIFVFLSVALLAGFEDFIPPAIHITADNITIYQTIYPLTIPLNKIESIEWKEDDFTTQAFYKDVGSATDRYLRGTFSAKGNPSVRLYLFRHKPYILFRLKDSTYTKLFFNHEVPEDTALVFQKIKQEIPEKISVSSIDSTDIENIASKEDRTNSLGSKKKKEAEPSDWKERRKTFTEAELDYSIPAGKGNLHAVLNFPSISDGKVPVVLIIGGSGPSTKEGIANIYLDLAIHLCDNQIASIRYDKRGVARSESVVDAVKDEDKLVIEDFVDDVAKLLEKMKSDSRFSGVYIAGHSEGALVGTLAAQKQEISGIICLSGAGRNIAEITLEQIKANPNNPQSLISDSERILNSLTAGKITEDVPKILEPLFRKSVQPYMISWIKYDPVAELAKLSLPTLIIQGDNDSQVQVIDAENLHRAVSDSQILIIPNMTHMLKDSDIRKEKAFMDTFSALKYTKVYQDDSLPINETMIWQIIQFIAEHDTRK